MPARISIRRASGFAFRKERESWRRDPKRRQVDALNLVVNFLPVDRDVRRSFDAQFDQVALGADNFDDDATVDDDVLVGFAGEYEHESF